MSVEAATIEEKATAQVDVKGAAVSVKGDTTLTLQGGIVKIN